MNKIIKIITDTKHEYMDIGFNKLNNTFTIQWKLKDKNGIPDKINCVYASLPEALEIADFINEHNTEG